MSDELLRWREEFPILEETVYMINNSLGAMPRAVYDSLRDYADTWNHRGVRAWEERWWGMSLEVGDLIGKILGAGPGEVTTHQNVTIAEAVILSSLPRDSKRNKIVYSALNFPSVRYLYQAAPGLQCQAVPCPDGIHVPLEPLLDAIDERTLAVPISHVIFKSAYIQEVEPIIEKAHKVGAYVILDTYQSCGTVPFDVSQWGADFVVGGSVKWLCGGPGLAYLWVRPDLRDQLKPRLTGWMAHQQPFEFMPEMEYAESGYRFLNGTPNVPALYAAKCGYEIIAQVGVERIRQKSLTMTDRLIELAREQGFEVNTPRQRDRRGGTVSVHPPNAQQVSQELIERGYMVDYRPGAGIRVAPHFYNTLDECEATIAEMTSIVQQLSTPAV
ncbi:MAG TPA: aminotransferase class V-fold PLP-dependent enzyme [Acidobacteriota bacterium]|nr:aminotransferase class V-fold PLP-dependent enzyme [Acidobacteriota bacterium]